MSLDLPDVDTCKNRLTCKWSNANGGIGAWVAEMDYLPPETIRTRLHEALEANTLGYMPAGVINELLVTARDYQRDTFGWELTKNQVQAAADVLSVLRGVISLSPKDCPVVVPTPAYFPFLSIPVAMSHPCVQVPSRRENSGRWCLDLAGIRQAFEASKGKGVFVHCNPWNPTGQCFTVSELEELAEVLSDFPRVLVFSDEIHSPLAFGAKHLPLVKVCPQLAGQTVTAFAASKGWNIPGLRCAQWAITDKYFMDSAQEILAFQAGQPTALGAIASSVAYRDCRDWLAQVHSQLRENVAVVGDWASGHRDFEVSVPEATYLSWWHTPGVSNPAERLKEAGLVVNSGASMGRDFAEYFRVNLACSPTVLREILAIVEKTF